MALPASLFELPEPDPVDRTTDAALDSVVKWFRAQPDIVTRLGATMRQAIDEVLDGHRTGRYDIATLEKTEKTYLGTKVEILLRTEFTLAKGRRMDFLVDGHDVDSKFSITGRWSIPTEAIGHLCLVSSADDRTSRFSVGIVRIEPGILNKGRNKDHKTTIAAGEYNRITWLARSARLPENLLLHLPSGVVEAIMAAGSGQRRVNELLRRVQGRVIDRNTAVTVARQADGLKRCRDARIHLAPEGIAVLGHQNDCPRIASHLELPTPRKGTFLAVRLTRVTREGATRPAVRLGDSFYAVARAEDPVTPVPPIKY